MLGALAVKSGGSKTPPRDDLVADQGAAPSFGALAGRISYLLQVNKLTKSQFSDLVGVHQSTVGLWISGKRTKITGEVAARIAEKMCTTTDWVQFGKGAPPKSRREQAAERRSAPPQPATEPTRVETPIPLTKIVPVKATCERQFSRRKVFAACSGNFDLTPSLRPQTPDEPDFPNSIRNAAKPYGRQLSATIVERYYVRPGDEQMRRCLVSKMKWWELPPD